MAVDYEAFKEWLESDSEVDFDLYAQDPNDWIWLQELIPGFIVSSAGGSVPFQAEGLFHGHPFYFRDRSGYATLSIGSTDGEKPYLGATTLYHAGCETKEFNGGSNFIKNLVRLIPKLSRTDFPYTFEVKKLIFDQSGKWEYEVSEKETDTLSSWGSSPEDALKNLNEVSEYLINAGCPAATQRKMLKDRAPSLDRVTSDTRVFPETDPDFRVNGFDKA